MANKPRLRARRTVRLPYRVEVATDGHHTIRNIFDGRVVPEPCRTAAEAERTARLLNAAYWRARR